VASQRDFVRLGARRHAAARQQGVRAGGGALLHAGARTREDLKAVFLQFSCLLGGLASQAHLFNSPAYVAAQLKLWTRQAKLVMHARKCAHAAAETGGMGSADANDCGVTSSAKFNHQLTAHHRASAED